MIINFGIYFLASIVAISIVVFVVYMSIRRWLKSNAKIRKAIFSYFELNDYLNLVRDYYLRLAEQKDNIQQILKSAIGRDEREVLEAFAMSYNELDRIMNSYLKSKQELENKLFSNSGSQNELGTEV